MHIDLFLTVALVVSLTAAVTDLLTRIIPNWLTLSALLLGPLLRLAVTLVQHGWAAAGRGAAWSFLGIVVCAAGPAWSFARGEMGGGDVKLFAAVGGLCGPILGFDAQAMTYAAILALVLPLRWVLTRWTVRQSGAAPTLAPLPLGPVIFVGLCLSIGRRALWQ